MTMTAEEAVRYLVLTYVVEAASVDPQTEDALGAVMGALALAYEALSKVEWDEWQGDYYCAFCGAGRHVGHYADCPGHLALAAIGKEEDEDEIR